MRLIDADRAVERFKEAFALLSGGEALPAAAVQKMVEIFFTTEKHTPTVEPVGNPERLRWVSVKDYLPTEIGQDCWVWCDGWEHDEREPELDWWEGRRGEKVESPDGGYAISSGFYHNDIEQITHWMPCQIPEPPEEGN